MKHLENLIKASIGKIEDGKIDVYSYALYFDHESKRRISICIDTKQNSILAVSKSNEFRQKYFIEFLDEGDFDSVKNFSFNSGRNYSLGDYKFRNMVSYEYSHDLDYSHSFILGAIRAIISLQDEITKFSTDPEQVLFSCSTMEDEFGVSWFKITAPLPSITTD